MTFNQSTGTANLRAEFIDGAVKGFADRMYKFKQALTIDSTSAWKNTFFRENPEVLSSAGGLSIKVPRGGQPAQGSVEWEKVSAYIEKFFYEDVIMWEDILTDEISVQSRTLFRVAEKITKDVDDTIWGVLSENASATADFTASAVQAVTIGATKHWSGSSAAIIDDIHNALALIASSNYDTSSAMMYVNPRDRRSIMRWLSDKGAQFPAVGNAIASNGFVGKIAGVSMIVSNSVTASHAIILVPRICATWKTAVAFRTQTIEDPFVSIKVRAVEEGVTQLTDPNAVVVISNTRGDDT